MKLVLIRVVLIALLTFFLKYLIDPHINVMDLIAPVILILGLINERRIYLLKKGNR